MTTETIAQRGTTTALHRAVLIGDMTAVQQYLADGEPIDVRDAEGCTPFLLACKHAEPEVFHVLLTAGADFEAVNARDMSGLFLVATTGVVSLARVLIDLGADVNRPAARGLTPLMAAVMSENPHMVQLLIAAGANVEHMDADGTSVLKWARMLGSKAMVELIREPMRNDEAQGRLGPDDLHRAAQMGDVELIRECLAAAVPIDTVDASGFTPLMVATRQGKRAAIAALLEAGADPYRASPSGLTPLLMAVNNPIALLPYAAVGADLNHAGENRGLCPLIYASRQGFEETVRYLISVGTDPHRIDRDGRSALDHAEANGHRRIARLLREVMERLS